MAKVKTITLAEVKRRIKGMDDERAKAMVCAMVGHSLITTACFGYIHCARCGEQIGDQLAGVFDGAEKCVRVGHNCDVCRKNYDALDWRHTFMSPDPFVIDDPSRIPVEIRELPAKKAGGGRKNGTLENNTPQG